MVEEYEGGVEILGFDSGREGNICHNVEGGGTESKEDSTFISTNDY